MVISIIKRKDRVDDRVDRVSLRILDRVRMYSITGLIYPKTYYKYENIWYY